MGGWRNIMKNAGMYLTAAAFALCLGCDGGNDRDPSNSQVKLTASDALIRTLAGGESLLDENSGTFAWVNADGLLVAFDAKTGATRQLNGAATAPPFATVRSVAVNSDGTVAWLYQADRAENGAYHSDYVAMDEKTEIARTGFDRQDLSMDLPASVAASGDYFVFSAPTDESGARIFRTYSASTGRFQSELMPHFAMFGGVAYDVRMHGTSVGFRTEDSYVTGDITGLNLSVYVESYMVATDFNGQSIAWATWYDNNAYIGTAGRLGENGYDLDEEARSKPTCTRCVAMSWDGRFAAWNATDGIRYADRRHQGASQGLVPGAAEFVLDGATLYYIAAGTDGSVGLYRRLLE